MFRLFQVILIVLYLGFGVGPAIAQQAPISEREIIVDKSGKYVFMPNSYGITLDKGWFSYIRCRTPTRFVMLQIKQSRFRVPASALIQIYTKPLAEAPDEGRLYLHANSGCPENPIEVTLASLDLPSFEIGITLYRKWDDEVPRSTNEPRSTGPLPGVSDPEKDSGLMVRTDAVGHGLIVEANSYALTKSGEESLGAYCQFDFSDCYFRADFSSDVELGVSAKAETAEQLFAARRAARAKVETLRFLD